MQEMQSIKFKRHNNNTLINLSSKSYYVMTGTNKWYSYPRVMVIQIDVHLAGENLTNTPHAFHAQSAYGPRPYVSHAINA
jgi:hypothetical protein